MRANSDFGEERGPGTPPPGLLIATARQPAPQDWRVSVHPLGDVRREEVEALIERVYARAYGALIRRHFPTLVCVRDHEGRIAAAAGFRPAAAEPLFLEQYLDQPIEAAISAALGKTTARGQIGEIGNLVSEDCSATSRLFIELSRHLRAAGCRAAAATLTRPLRRRLTRAGVGFTSLAQARPARLVASEDEWGSYFAHSPEVVAGEIGWEPFMRSVR